MSTKKKEGTENSPTTAGNADVVLLGGPTADNQGLRVLRARKEGVEFGEVRPLKEGQPITGDVVQLHPRKDMPFLCDVETSLRVNSWGGLAEPESPRQMPPANSARTPGPRPLESRVGPAQVATQAYRDNWDAIWSRGLSGRGSSELN